MYPTAPLRRALVALCGLSLVACQQDVAGPAPALRAESSAGLDLASGSTQLVLYNFENVPVGSRTAAPTSVASTLVTVTPVTRVLGTGVANLREAVVNFGDRLFAFPSGVYQPTNPRDYSAFQVGIEQNVLPADGIYKPIAGVVERRNASGVLLGSYPISIASGFASNSPPRYVTVDLSGVVLTSQTTYFRFRMDEDIWGTQSQYTAQLFLDDLSFDGAPYCAPTVQITAPTTATEGEAVSIAATSSVAGLTTTWDLGDGTTGTGDLAATHVYADNGVYQVSVTVDDGIYPPVSASHTITVANVAPTVSPFSGAEILAGETYTASGSFADAGADTHTATVSYEGAAQSLALTGTSFSLSHAYAAAGSYTVTVSVSDDDGGVGTSSATVTVLSPAQGAQEMKESVSALLAAGALSASEAGVLSNTLTSVQASLAKGNTVAALAKLHAFDAMVNAMLKSRRISTQTAQELTAASARLQQSIRKG
jgi:PKD repeat protein